MPLTLVQSDVDLFPLLFRHPYTNQFNGVFLDVWKMWASTLNESEVVIMGSKDFGGITIDHDPSMSASGEYSGILGLVHNGTVDGAIEDFPYAEDKIRNFGFTTTGVTYALSAFYERVRISTSWTLNSFLVFPPQTLILIFGVIAFVHGSEKLLSIIQSYINNPQNSRSVIASVHTFGFLMLFLIYSSAFAGNASTVTQEPRTTMEQFTTMLKNGQSQIVSTDGFFSDENLLELYGEKKSFPSERLSREPDLQKLSDKLCDDSDPSSHVAAYIILFQLFSRNPVRPHNLRCQVETLDVSNRKFMASSLPSFEGTSLGEPYPGALYVNKQRFTRRQMDRFSVIVMKMYDIEKQDTLWWRRYTGRVRQTFSVPAVVPQYSYNPIPLKSFTFIFLIVGGVDIAALVILLLELCYIRKFGIELKLRQKILHKTYGFV